MSRWGKDVELSGWLLLHHVKVCSGLLCPSSGTVWALSACPQWLWLMCNPNPDAPPLHPASGDLALQLHTVCEVWHTFPAVHHSCVVTPPSGQTKAPASRTNTNNYQTLQSRFPEKGMNTGQLMPKCLTWWRNKGSQQEIHSDVPTTTQCYDTEIRHISVSLVS